MAGDDKDAKAAVAELVRDLGARPIDIGDLRHAGVIEAMTVALVQINRRYKTKSATFRVVGIE
jgi:predicted dinucleotide-binding enzyme